MVVLPWTVGLAGLRLWIEFEGTAGELGQQWRVGGRRRLCCVSGEGLVQVETRPFKQCNALSLRESEQVIDWPG